MPLISSPNRNYGIKTGVAQFGVTPVFLRNYMKKAKIIVIVYKLSIILASLFFVLTFLLPFLKLRYANCF